jgi:hypothetical protein
MTEKAFSTRTLVMADDVARDADGSIAPSRLRRTNHCGFTEIQPAVAIPERGIASPRRTVADRTLWFCGLKGSDAAR